ncbi:unnamed protein product [Effrenium voratum]|nr:unnamed protein product [Effrenium voratum]
MLSPGRRGPIQPHRFVHPAGYSPVQVYQADCWRQTRVVRQTLVDNSAKVGLPFQAGACGSFTARPEGRACPSAPGPSPPASEEERISALLASVFQRPPEETEPVRPKQLEVRPKGSGFHGARAPAKVLCTPPSPLPQSRVTQMPRSASYQPPVNPTLLAARQPSVPRGYLQAALRPEVAQQSLEQALEAQKPAGGSSGEVNTCELEKVEPLDVSLEEPPKEVPDTGPGTDGSSICSYSSSEEANPGAAAISPGGPFSARDRPEESAVPMPRWMEDAALTPGALTPFLFPDSLQCSPLPSELSVRHFDWSGA